MLVPTIDRHDAVELFHQMLVVSADQRILRLLGQAKMGKSHLITKIFPMLSEKHAAYCAIVDLRGISIDLAMKMICEQIGVNYFPNYLEAFEDWSDRVNSPVVITGIGMIFSKFSIRYNQSGDESYVLIRKLRDSFIKDLTLLSDKLIVLIFDAIDEANEKVRDWLLRDLLVPLSRLAHIRVVLAGRELPSIDGAYQRFCHSYDLRPVEELDFYVQYCRVQNYSLSNEEVLVLAKASRFAPGMFVELIDYVIKG